jgi:hypothetical protein
LSKNGITLENDYKIDGRKVDLYELYQTVIVKGMGGDRVTQEMRWGDMARFVPGLQPLMKSKKALAALANLYERVLAPFEVAWGTALLAQREKLLQATGATDLARSSGGATGGTKNPDPVQAPFPALPVRRSSKDRDGSGRRGPPISKLEWGSDKSCSVPTGAFSSTAEAQFHELLEVPQEWEEDGTDVAQGLTGTPGETHRRKRNKSMSSGTDFVDISLSPTTSTTGSTAGMSTSSTHGEPASAASTSSAPSRPTPAHLSQTPSTEDQSAADILAATPSVEIASDAVDAASAWLLDQPPSLNFEFDMDLGQHLNLDFDASSTQWSPGNDYRAASSDYDTTSSATDFGHVDLWTEVGLPMRYREGEESSA